ncbi:hypothetical protein D1007_05160 [Hordeum vulgare]|nr:hypothetical protein D1007_05160 [Hordeum vulgare]
MRRTGRPSEEVEGRGAERESRVWPGEHSRPESATEDLLLGFLTYPRGCVIKNMHDTDLASPLGTGGMANLYTSVVELDATSSVAGGYSAETLLNPPLSPFCRHPDCSTPKKDVVEPKTFMGLVSYSSWASPGGGLRRRRGGRWGCW